MGAPDQPTPQQVQLQPWGLDVQQLGVGGGGKKIFGVIVSRNFGERIVLTGQADEITNALRIVTDKLRQLDTGILIAPANTTLPPLNGHN